MFRVPIPDNVFYDPENGFSSNLTLTLSDSMGIPLPNDSWIQIVEQTIEGIPLQEQVQYGAITDYVFLLRAKDDQENSAHSFLTVRINPQRDLENFLVVFFEGDFALFDQHLSTKIDLIILLATFPGLPEEMAISTVHVEGFRNGSIGVSYNNLSISDLNCAEFHSWVETIYTNGHYTIQFIQALAPYTPTSIPFIEGLCNGTNQNIPPTIGGIENADTHFFSDQIILVSTVVPATVVSLILVLIGIAAFILYHRHRKERNQLVRPNMGRTFLNRRPVILENEMDLPTRRRAPVIISNEPADDGHGSLESYDSSSDEEILNYSLMPSPYHRGFMQTDPPPYRMPPQYPS